MTAGGRDLWRWPFWSWRHLGLSCFVLALLLGAAGRLQAISVEVSAGPRPTRPPTTVASSETPAVAAHATTRTPEPSPSPSSSGLSEMAAPSVARAFVELWARPYEPRSVWVARLRPLCTAAFGRQLEAVDPGRVPATAATGTGTLLTESSGTAEVRQPTDNGAVIVALTQSDRGWLVDGLRPDDWSEGTR